MGRENSASLAGRNSKMSAIPWFKFYPQDWRGDAKLQMCCLGARGLWIELCSVMHEAEPYGHLIVNGHPVTDTQLALLVGGPSDQISEYLGELESAGVFSRNAEGVIYSRRMTRDYKKANVAKKNGRQGGNPTLRKQRGNPPSDNPKDKGVVKAQKPEARSQIDAIASSPGARNLADRRPPTPIPENWTPTEETLRSGDMEIFDRDETNWLCIGFRDHAQQTDRRESDWQAAARRWLRTGKSHAAIRDRRAGNANEGASRSPAEAAAKWAARVSARTG